MQTHLKTEHVPEAGPMKQLKCIIIGVCSIFAVAGCSSPPVPTDTFYNLTSGRAAIGAGAAQLGGIVEVPRFRADGVINERAIVYRASATEQRQYTYHYWAEPPAIMVQRSFIDALRIAGSFDQVAGPEMRAGRDYELIGTLRRFEHDVSRVQGRAAVEMEVALRQVRGGETLFLKTYESERSAGRDISGAVEALSAAVNDIIAEVLQDISAEN